MLSFRGLLPSKKYTQKIRVKNGTQVVFISYTEEDVKRLAHCCRAAFFSEKKKTKCLRKRIEEAHPRVR